MAKSSGIRKTLEQLIKKVETLENQGFAQRLLIDELENKLSRAEEIIQKMKDDPFGFGNISAPIYVPTAVPAPFVPYVPPTIPPVFPNWNTQPHYPNANHTCSPGPADWTGATYCIQCFAQLTESTLTLHTSTIDNTTTVCQADPASQSSDDVEPTLEFDITWVISDEPTK